MWVEWNLLGPTNKKNPTLIKLDRILATSCWDTFYNSCFAWSKARVGSDHSPIVLDTGEGRRNRAKYFFFQEKWLQSEDFGSMVRDKWSDKKLSFPTSSYSLDIWHGCLQSLRRYLRGWNLQRIGQQKEIMNSISMKIEDIDLIAEERLLSFSEWKKGLS